jgi:predicted GNAT family acetyltransferase
MRILHPGSLAEFIGLTTEFLSRHEAEHGLLLGVARASRNPAPDAYFGVVLEAETPVAAAMRLDWRLILSRENAPGAIAMVAADGISPLLRVVLGPSRSVERFAEASSQEWRTVMVQGIYECRRVTPPAQVEGKRRLATPNDRGRLGEWLRSFVAEALHETISDSEALARVDGHIAAQDYSVWEVDGSMVSLAAAVAPTVHGIRVNNVYTPREFRGRGYASALVASLTDSLLSSGYDFTFLHTDLTNPTSNRIYQRIGYRQVATFQMAELIVANDGQSR